ncbi:Sugar (and other) transporter family protein [Saccharomyces cerevisiae]|nr:Sugar (and other) transporter family protein [Saccharomyces cerevisiae]
MESPIGLGFAWALFMIGGMTFVPESPRYLAEVGKIEEAKRSIAVSNKVAVDDPSVLAEVEAVLAGVEAEKLAGNASWGELFASKNKGLQRLIMGAMIQSLQQLTGDNYFFYYGTTIFKAVGLSDSFETSIVLGIVNFASTFVGIYVVDRYGRRTCLLWGAASMTACMVVYASVGVTRLWPNGQDQPSSKGAGNCMIVFACFYIFCFATTWAPIPFVVNSETFPLRVKSKFVPETKGLTLEEVNTMWEEGVLPWKSASWVPPSRRGANYDAEEMTHDDKPLYKRMFSTK